MYPLALVAAVLIGLIVFMNQQLSINTEAMTRREAQTLATNASIYLGRAKAYVRSNPGFSGNVPDAVLGLPNWYTKLDGISCYAASGKGYVYFPNVSDRRASDAASLMQMEHGYGKNESGTMRTPKGDVFPVPSQIPNGVFVIQF
ncbi:type IV pilus biogenesis protein PilM [Xanthomonas campestris pv. campestris]|uniref:type IV pilus biogenesis protein PilM n=1 Tax=Xanthomonas campestris TaxID=339 RepID=UPI001E543CFC|nr:type IV pilus biogenesis protein PilM [Xanthomonas campestris]MCD0253120.1 type IV pilus biogenesis protein PilM [Xanthomonas campestris pv. campestris]